MYKKLMAIQAGLKAPKAQYNAFAEFKYRSTEDILEALKPLLKEQECILTISDDMVMLGDRFYVKATATISDGNQSISTTAFAREMLTKKKMDDSQVTGATSSYARKYALNGLFAIDDTKDSDFTNQGDKGQTNVPGIDLEPLYRVGKLAGYTKAQVNSHLQAKYKKSPNKITEEELQQAHDGYTKKIIEKEGLLNGTES